jgi:hypothetical protein
LYHLKERKKKSDGKGKQMGEVTHSGDLKTGSFFQLLSGPLKASYSSIAASQALTNAESSQISSWVSSRLSSWTDRDDDGPPFDFPEAEGLVEGFVVEFFEATAEFDEDGNALGSSQCAVACAPWLTRVVLLPLAFFAFLAGGGPLGCGASYGSVMSSYEISGRPLILSRFESQRKDECLHVS